MTQNTNEFIEAAKERYGEKVAVLDREELTKVASEKAGYDVGPMVEKWGDMLVMPGDKCPECGWDLGGILGSFQWGIVHGEGFCANCRKTEFRLYHCLKDQDRLTFFELIGFSNGKHGGHE